MRLLRRTVLVLSLLCVVLTLSLWVRSQFTIDSLALQHTIVDRNAATPDGQLGAWTIRSTTFHASPSRGSLVLTRSVYESLQDAKPIGATLSAFREGDGVRLTTFDRAQLVPDPHPHGYYHTPTDWRFAGFGAYPFARGAALHATLELPLWFVALVWACPAAVISRSACRQRFRRRKGLCLHCGHDLTGARLVCSECGNEFALA
ncbi:MAG: hypothetical protein IT438_12810 [Phycisphaerales bacterium]|nr:hypothetical protein [Phycisphaerales bacterium]